MVLFRKSLLARAYLIVALPFWFPRLVVCLIIDWWRFHFKDWLPGTGNNPSWGGEGPPLEPVLMVYRGGKKGRPGRQLRQANPLGLRLIEGGEAYVRSKYRKKA